MSPANPKYTLRGRSDLATLKLRIELMEKVTSALQVLDMPKTWGEIAVVVNVCAALARWEQPQADKGKTTTRQTGEVGAKVRTALANILGQQPPADDPQPEEPVADDA